MPLYAISGAKLDANRVGDLISFTKDLGSDTNLSVPLTANQRDRLVLRTYRMMRRFIHTSQQLTDEDDG